MLALPQLSPVLKVSVANGRNGSQKMVHKNGCVLVSASGEPAFELGNETHLSGLHLVHRDTFAWSCGLVNVHCASFCAPWLFCHCTKFAAITKLGIGSGKSFGDLAELTKEFE